MEISPGQTYYKKKGSEDATGAEQPMSDEQMLEEAAFASEASPS